MLLCELELCTSMACIQVELGRQWLSRCANAGPGDLTLDKEVVRVEEKM
jgi:hypothetical protein